jgi:hypothetical protein
VQCQAKLLELIFALGSPCRFARLLHRRKQNGNQYRNNRDDHEQFNQGESTRDSALTIDFESLHE